MDLIIPDAAYHIPIQLRWEDTDMAGHVNHAKFLTYLEIARVEWIKDQGPDSGFASVPIIIAKVEIDYLKPLFLQDQPVVSMWVDRIGTKSYTHKYVIHSENDDGSKKICASASSIQVFFDYNKNASVAIPDPQREELENYLVE